VQRSRCIPVLLLGLVFGCGRDSGIESFPTVPAGTTSSSLPGRSGAVYTLSNAASGNEVLSYLRHEDGSLSDLESTPTAGMGTGTGLGSQSALIVSDEDRLMFAVDAGSNDIASLRITPRGLRTLGTTPSGGERPISITRHERMLFVLNAGAEGGITGFRIGGNGRLVPIPGSTQGLGGAATNPAQIAFTPDGAHLVVTEKATNAIAVYNVSEDGSVSAPDVQASAGQTPFGFAFAREGALIVSEASLSSASSYHVGVDGMLEVVSAAVPTLQRAACWVAVPWGGEFAYTTNAASNTLSGFRVGENGSISLLDASGVTATADGTPIDAAFDASGTFLYVLNGGAHSLNVYRRGEDGHLDPLTGVSGLPAGGSGLAAF
jgi:6-phosphogluconolactonase